MKISWAIFIGLVFFGGIVLLTKYLPSGGCCSCYECDVCSVSPEDTSEATSDACSCHMCGSCAVASEAQPVIQSVQAEQKIASEFVLINLLDKELFDDCRIKGSINVPFEQLEEFAKNRLDKNAKIIVYCSDYFCSASGQAYKLLKKLGFTSVRAYEGGIVEAYKEGLPVEGSCQLAYIKRNVVKPEGSLNSEIETISVQELKDLVEKIEG